jgi:hypothetical protein
LSNFSETWRIDGVTAAYITRGPANGQYRVLFERSQAELADIEAINWASPAVELLRADITGILGLPEGCGFTVADITYDHGSRSYTVTVQVASQYLGDVSGYQAQVAELEEQVAGAQAQAAELEEQVADAQAQAAEKDETIAAQAREIEALKADSGAAVVEALEQAYEEGVESNG